MAIALQGRAKALAGLPTPATPAAPASSAATPAVPATPAAPVHTHGVRLPPELAALQPNDPQVLDYVARFGGDQAYRLPTANG
jgi:hypothetical protein